MTRPRPILCVIEHLHRNLAVADDACVGRFTLAGITLDLGPEPDWLGAELPEDEEWRIEWTKFYYGLDLAHASALTADPRYLAAWQRLVGSYIRDVPVGVDSSDVAARRVQNWVYAWSAFAAAPRYAGLDPHLEPALMGRIDEQTRYIRDNLTAERNHRTLELYALLVVALSLPDLDPHGALVAFAADELESNLLTDVRPDGVHREHSTHYHLIALRSFLGARENLRRHGRELSRRYDERLSAACDFALHCHRPDGAIPATSDSDNGHYQDVLALGATVLGREDLRYAATGGRAGTPPRARHASFPDGGYWTQRSGWGDGERAFRDERFLIFDCGQIGDGGHGHYDVLGFEAAADGRPLVVDPGRFTYSEEGENLRHWFKGTAAHNTVVVDGLDQVPYRRGKPRKGTLPVVGFRERLSGPGLDILDGVVASTAYEARHRRRIAFIGESYWLVVDDLRGERAHRYDLRFHLPADAAGATHVGLARGAWVVSSPGLALVGLGDVEPRIETGWVAPEYGVRHEAPVVSFAVDGAISHTFATLVVPRSAGEAVPSVAWVHGETGWTLRVRDGDVTDAVEWRDAADVVGCGPLTGAGRAAWLREVADEAVAATLIADTGWSSWRPDVGRTRGVGGAW